VTGRDSAPPTRTVRTRQPAAHRDAPTGDALDGLPRTVTGSPVSASMTVTGRPSTSCPVRGRNGGSVTDFH
jgi:hypothetical protein